MPTFSARVTPSGYWLTGMGVSPHAADRYSGGHFSHAAQRRAKPGTMNGVPARTWRSSVARAHVAGRSILMDGSLFNHGIGPRAVRSPHTTNT